MTGVEARLRRLERAVVDPVNAVTVEWPPEGEPPLRPGWHPELSLFVMKWPDEEEVESEA